MSALELCLIVAMADNRVIGRAEALPWRLSADLRRFKALTMGHPLLMGRKTFESIGRPLPGRTNIVITRDPNARFEGCVIAHSLDDAIAHARTEGARRAFIIGGAQIYAAALPRVDTIEMTEVHAAVEGDTIFPPLDGAWREQSRERFDADEKNEHPYSFVRLQRETNAA